MIKKMKYWFYKQALSFVLNEHKKYHNSQGHRGIRLEVLNANLNEAVFFGTSFKKSLFSKTNFEKASFLHCNIFNANFQDVSFFESRFVGCIFRKTHMDDAVFDEAFLYRPSLTGTVFKKSKLNLHTRNRHREELLRLKKKLEAFQAEANKLEDLTTSQMIKMHGLMDVKWDAVK